MSFLDEKGPSNYLVGVDEAYDQGYNWPWTPLHLDGGLKQIFPNFMPVDLAKYGVTIICRYSKDMNFHKIWRV